jgi:hypothetical protein
MPEDICTRVVGAAYDGSWWLRLLYYTPTFNILYQYSDNFFAWIHSILNICNVFLFLTSAFGSDKITPRQNCEL